MSETGEFDMSIDDLLNIDSQTEGFVEFDIDPSIFDEEMDLPCINPMTNTGKQFESEPNTSTSTNSGRIGAFQTKIPGRADVEKFISEQENKNTMRKTFGDIKKLEKFMCEK